MTTYKIVRSYKDHPEVGEIIASGLTLEEAKAHCQDPETSSHTATSKAAKTRTAESGEWFDGFMEDQQWTIETSGPGWPE